MTQRRPDLMAVDPALLKRFMLDDIHARAEASLAEPLGTDLEERLGRGPERMDQRLARAGYLTRVVETERFEPARRPMPWLRALLKGAGGDRCALARELALAEPLEKPAPDDPTARTWQVPGPGGHVRYFLAVRWSGGDEAGRRSWLYGFFLRCCEEEGEHVSSLAR